MAAVEITAVYEGDLHTTATHGPSGATFATDAPVDNEGKGEEFSPTDLVGTAMGTCMLTIMGIYARNHGLEIEGAHVRVVKEMSADLPRRIVKLSTEIEVPLPEDHPRRAGIEKAALSCPVHQSLHADMEKPVVFRWVG
ncbi:MAG: OsmC family protein [Verrucomicrobiales bacterium]|nr:OsmC family protein [Verrucomicrobiales bacterium]